MKIAIYHPNLHMMAGGEFVAMTIASALKDQHEVTVFITKTAPPISDLETFFDVNLQGVTFKEFGKWITKMPTLHTLKKSLHLRSLQKTLNTFDLVIDTCSNGLFYKNLKPKTIAYIHFPNYPKPKSGLKSILNLFLIKEKNMFNYDLILCNSKFTQNQVKAINKDKKTKVVYPPVKIHRIKPKTKKKIILSVGRFSPQKKHETMIESYIGIERKLPRYKLLLRGAFNKDGGYEEDYMDMLQEMAKNHSVELITQRPIRETLKSFESAQIYWHARGYGENDPVEYENFGITTVEAMAGGCIPIVINKGAQPEIVKHGINGYCWNTIEELKDFTLKAIKKDHSKMIKENMQEVQKYSLENFIKEIKNILSKL